jgi:hypothetical protein
MNIEWLAPWRPIDDPDLARVFEEELARELASNHLLANLALRAIGQHSMRDEFLFRLDDGTNRVALVRLTWTGRREKPPWPESRIYENEADWMANGMHPDHDETTMGM